MPMCVKKCGECGLCIAHQAQGVIDEKDAEIARLKRAEPEKVKQLTRDLAQEKFLSEAYRKQIQKLNGEINRLQNVIRGIIRPPAKKGAEPPQSPKGGKK